MTEEQVNRTVQHLCEQLHVAIRLKEQKLFPQMLEISALIRLPSKPYS